MGREKLKLLESKEQALRLVSSSITPVEPPNSACRNPFSAYAIIGVIL